MAPPHSIKISVGGVLRPKKKNRKIFAPAQPAGQSPNRSGVRARSYQTRASHDRKSICDFDHLVGITCEAAWMNELAILKQMLHLRKDAVSKHTGIVHPVVYFRGDVGIRWEKII